jgi:dihydropteroate synthase
VTAIPTTELEGHPPIVMGVLNVTPDSFSDGGQFVDPDAAVAHGRRLFAEGAAIVDVGGESTRPGAEPVSVDDERRRVIPVIAELARHGRVSIDTRKAAIAEAAVEAGATIINDVSASLHRVAADAGVVWIAMHMRGEPATMQADPQYHDVVDDVRRFLLARAEAGLAAGVPEVWIDPGIGFGKTSTHNLSLLRRLPEITRAGHPVVVGTSRKSFVGLLHRRSDGLGDLSDAVPASDRLEGSLATAVWALACGARVVRVHDVAETVAAVRICSEGVAA